MKYVYLIQSLEDGRYKIGISKNPNIRIKSIQTGNSSPIKIIDKYLTENAFYIEGVLHRKYSHFRKNGEWFELSINEEVNFINECKKIEENLIILKENNNYFT